MNLNIDEAIFKNFDTTNIKVYFYDSGCEWTKINLTWDFDKTWLEKIELNWVNIFFETKDKEHLDWWKIVLKPSDNKNWHSSTAKYLFISPKVSSRCGCASSFSFEKKLIPKDKLAKLKAVFKS